MVATRNRQVGLDEGAEGTLNSLHVVEVMEFDNLEAQVIEIMKQPTPPLLVERRIHDLSLGRCLEVKRDLLGGGGSCGGVLGSGGGRSGSGSDGGRGGSGGSGGGGGSGDGSSGRSVGGCSSGDNGGSSCGGGGDDDTADRGVSGREGGSGGACGSGGGGGSSGTGGGGGGGGGGGCGGGGGGGGSSVPLHSRAMATTLYNEAAALMPRMQSTTDPATHRKLACRKPQPNVALAAAGLGLHRGVYRRELGLTPTLPQPYPNLTPTLAQPHVLALSLALTRALTFALTHALTLAVALTPTLILTLALTLTQRYPTLTRHPSRAMTELNSAYPNSIPTSVQKNPRAVKGWRQRFARCDERMPIGLP